jgi:2-acylglycerol O-acyltransferase 2
MVTDATGFSSKFPGLELRGLAASFCFYVPIYRDLLLAGFVCDAARYSAKRLLDSGKSIFLVPGGATEALYASPEEDVLVLKSRKGFVRLALQYGADLIPCFSFNENNTFSQLSTSHNSHPWISKLKKKFQAVFGISLPLITNIIPKRAEVVTVVGAPIPVGKAREPTEREVEETLETYIKALKALYAEHGPKYNQPRDKKLVIN